MKAVAEQATLSTEAKVKIEQALVTAAKAYKRERGNNNVWRACEGKEVLTAIARTIGFVNRQAYEKAVMAYWLEQPEQVPSEVLDLRRYVDSL